MRSWGHMLGIFLTRKSSETRRPSVRTCSQSRLVWEFLCVADAEGWTNWPWRSIARYLFSAPLRISWSIKTEKYFFSCWHLKSCHISRLKHRIKFSAKQVQRSWKEAKKVVLFFVCIKIILKIMFTALLQLR